MEKLRLFFEKHTNLLLHLFAGYTIASIVTNLTFLQEGYHGWDIVLCSVPGIIVAAVLGILKEFLDYEKDWTDILFTVIGGVINLLFIVFGNLLFTS